MHSFVLASALPAAMPSSVSSDTISDRIERRISRDRHLRFYNGNTHELITKKPPGYQKFLTNANVHSEASIQGWVNSAHRPTLYQSCSCDSSKCVQTSFEDPIDSIDETSTVTTTGAVNNNARDEV